MTTPDPFAPGYRLTDGNQLNDRVANPQWSTTASLTAKAGGTVLTSAKIVETVTQITAAAAPNAGVVIEQALPGRLLWIVNNSPNQIVVFAEGGSTIDGIPGDIGITLSAGDSAYFVATDVNTWQSFLGYPAGFGNGFVNILTNITALRAWNKTAANSPEIVALVYNTVANDGGGLFYLDAADHVTPDNGTTVIVDLQGNRWKRELVQAGYIANVPAGNIAATTAQGAINELDAEKVSYTALAASSGSSLVGFIQAGTGAQARTAQSKLRERISVFDFMTAAQIADVQAGTLSVDVTAAIQAAVTYAGSIILTYNPVVSGHSTSAVATIPTLYFPKGRYSISSAITLGAYVTIEGDYAVISQTDVNADIFTGLFYEWIIQGMTFVGGRFQISYYNANINAARIAIRDCDFTLSSSYAIKSAATGGVWTHLSANVVIDNCRFLAPNKVFDNCSDIAKFSNCWVQVEKTTMTDGTAAFNNQGSTGFPRLIIDNMIGVPVMGTPPSRFSNTRWIDNYFSVSAYDTRFGGEDAGMSIVHQLGSQDTAYPANAAEINLDRCWLYAGLYTENTAGVIFIQGHVPNRISIKNCSGPAQSPFVVNPATNLTTYFSNWQTTTGLPAWQYFCMDINNNVFSIPEGTLNPYASAGRVPQILRDYMATTGAMTRQMKLITSGTQNRGPTDPIQFGSTSFNTCGIFSGATPSRINMPAGCTRAQIHVFISVTGTSTAKSLTSFVRDSTGLPIQGMSGWFGATVSPGVDLINYTVDVTGVYGNWFDIVVQQPSGAALDIADAYVAITPMDFVG